MRINYSTEIMQYPPVLNLERPLLLSNAYFHVVRNDHGGNGESKVSGVGILRV